MSEHGPHNAIPLYGGKRAVINHYYASFIDKLGLLNRFEKIDWQRVRRLVFVCKGNICRSPYAERRARTLGASAISCGFECGMGEMADPRAIENAAQRGVDLTQHRTSSLEGLTIGPHDLFVAVEPAHGRTLAGVAKSSGAQVTLLGLWSHPRRPFIRDPFGLEGAAFQACFAAIDAGLAEMVRRVAPPHHRPSHGDLATRPGGITKVRGRNPS